MLRIDKAGWWGARLPMIEFSILFQILETSHNLKKQFLKKRFIHDDKVINGKVARKVKRHEHDSRKINHVTARPCGRWPVYEQLGEFHPSLIGDMET